MDFKHSIAPVLLLALLASPLEAQRHLGGALADGASLRTVRATFAAADANRDGLLDAREAVRAGIPVKAFDAFDADGDGFLSQDEFFVYYRELLAGLGKPVGAELEHEVARISEQRRVRESQRERKRHRIEQGSASSQQSAVSVQHRLVRARRALERSVDVRAAKPGETRSDAVSRRDRRGGLPVRRISTEERLARARAALDLSREPPGERRAAAQSEDRLDVDFVRGRLERARRALEDRARQDGTTRSRSEREVPSLDRRVRDADRGR